MGAEESDSGRSDDGSSRTGMATSRQGGCEGAPLECSSKDVSELISTVRPPSVDITEFTSSRSTLGVSLYKYEAMGAWFHTVDSS